VAKTWQIILATVAIFVAGLVTGGATAIGVVRWVVRHRGAGQPGQFGQHPGQVQQMNAQLMRGFAYKLNLTPDQRRKVGEIMRRGVKTMQDEIGDILDPDQKTKFDELISEQKARMQRFRQMQQQQQGMPPGPGQP
jgi:Spy/CpxP family protein refolding chaperone